MDTASIESITDMVKNTVTAMDKAQKMYNNSNLKINYIIN